MCKPYILVSVVVLSVFKELYSLENGLARTPPMGWLDWERFRCNRDCKHYPRDCIGERLIMDMADRMSADGYRAAGYQYVIVDDCWPMPDRDPVTRALVPDPEQFPHGIPALAEYVHARGLKFGIYQDYGYATCAGYPGMKYYMQIDAQTFADWGVDYLKLDTCYAGDYSFKGGYPPVNFYLNITKRPIVLGCEYPDYQLRYGFKPNYAALADACNLARGLNDVSDGWDSILSIIESYGENKFNFSEYARPGFWNDPDMLVVGDFGLSEDQERVQFGMWAMFAAPLLMSVDLRSIRPESKAMLLNANIIRIDQDSRGVPGRRVINQGSVQVWTRFLEEDCYAIAYLYLGEDVPRLVSFTLAQLGLTNQDGYALYEAFQMTSVGRYALTDQLNATVNPSGIYMFRAIPYAASLN